MYCSKMKLVIFFIILIVKNILGDEVLVKVKQGWLSGETIENVLGGKRYYSFKGIPYARPPIGSLRFKAPKPPLYWKGVRNATEHGSTCPYVEIFEQIYHPGSEDCLFLNVYSPNITTQKLVPVMFFIHGGGYRSFSGNVDRFGPDFLLLKGVVIVTINYRLDSLGFLCMDTKEVPGNAGLKDQVAALKWVKDNIQKFGGDPNMVTIFGESAGGASVTFHLMSPLSKGYFQRAIAISGSALNDWSIPFQPVRRAFMLGQILGHETRNKTDLLHFLQSVSYDNLVNTASTILAAEEVSNILTKTYPFTPVYEKDCGQRAFITADPETILNSGVINDVDFMTGNGNAEGLVAIVPLESLLLARYKRYKELLVPVKILIKATPDTVLSLSSKIHQYFFGSSSINIGTMKEMVNYISNSSNVYDIHRFIRRLPNPGKKARYLFKMSLESNRVYYGAAGARYNLSGVAHSDTLLYLFDAKAMNMTLKRNTLEYKLVDMVTTLFTNFAKFGNPTPSGSFRWPQYDNVTLSYADIGNKLTASTAPDEVHWQFWKSILNSVGIEF